jgi:hypothetical protein
MNIVQMILLWWFIIGASMILSLLVSIKILDKYPNSKISNFIRKHIICDFDDIFKNKSEK